MKRVIKKKAKEPADLSPEARQAVEARKITGAWSGRALLKLLAELENWDLTIELRKARTKRIWIACIVGSVVGFFAMFVAGSITESFLIAPIPFVIPLFGALYFKRRLNHLSRADIPNEVRVAIRPMLKQLIQDLHPKEKIRVTLNLTGLDQSQSKFRKMLPPGRNRTLELTVFEEEICDMRLPLADGSTAVLRLDNTFHRLERGYKSSRGKLKSKTKWKKETTASAMLIPPARINWEPSRMQKYVDGKLENLTFTEKNGVMVARLDRYYKFKEAGNPPSVSLPPEDLVGLFVRLSGMRPIAPGSAR